MNHIYNDIISLENLFLAWQEFIVGKKNKIDVIKFSCNLMDNIVDLHENLVNHTFCHDDYKSFYVNDPKRRHIHKAGVRDRVLHHAVYRILYSFFEKTFIADSFSCQNNKGLLRAIDRFHSMILKVSNNSTASCWILKCDIKKFFASIDHDILLNILKWYIPDEDINLLLKNIVESFSAGLPLGNLTSQLFSNVYMNVFDQWVKHSLKAKHYIRYADDFIFISHDKSWLESIIPCIKQFLTEHLKLTLHPNKISLKTIGSGIDFLGWVHFPNHRVLRTVTKRRVMRRIVESPVDSTLQSYLGLLSHGNAYKVKRDILGEYWLGHYE